MEPAHRFEREPRPAAQAPEGRPGARTVVVEGEIGAGKTELIRGMGAALAARGLAVCTILEPVAQWHETGALQRFYADPARHAYAFQTFVFATRVLAIAAAVEAAPAADVYLLERSPATDQLFMRIQPGASDPVEAEMYRAWCGAWERLLPAAVGLGGPGRPPTAQVLYLRTSLARCMGRTAARRRPGEVAAEGSASAEKGPGVTLEYQTLLRRAHERFFLGHHPDEFPGLAPSRFPAAAVVEVPPALADRNFRDAGPERDSVVAAVLALLGL